MRSLPDLTNYEAFRAWRADASRWSMLLHHASDPKRHICIDGWQDKADDLYQLQELIWPG